MSLEKLESIAANHALEVIGLCRTTPEDNLDDGTLALLGPLEPGFWQHVQGAPEFSDGARDPLDRWSLRVVSHIAEVVGGTPVFPFGTPARPFLSWALRSGRIWSSPVGLLVHDRAGLMVSFRGAVLLPQIVSAPVPMPRPCDSCETRPCLSACPVEALGAAGYHIPVCHSFLDQPDGSGCMSQGCAVRRACPVSQAYPRDPAQSAFHMTSFHPGN